MNKASRCDWCNELAVEPEYEQGGEGFMYEGEYVRAKDDEYLVVYRCQSCGKFHGYSFEHVEEPFDEPISDILDLDTWNESGE